MDAIAVGELLIRDRSLPEAAALAAVAAERWHGYRDDSRDAPLVRLRKALEAALSVPRTSKVQDDCWKIEIAFEGFVREKTSAVPLAIAHLITKGQILWEATGRELAWRDSFVQGSHIVLSARPGAVLRQPERLAS